MKLRIGHADVYLDLSAKVHRPDEILNTRGLVSDLNIRHCTTLRTHVSYVNFSNCACMHVDVINKYQLVSRYTYYASGVLFSTTTVILVHECCLLQVYIELGYR